MRQNMAIRADFEAHALPQVDDLYGTALYMLDSESEAQDIVKVSIARAYHAWLRLDARPDCRVWLFTIMAHALINRQRPSPSLSKATNYSEDSTGYPALGRPAEQVPVVDLDRVPPSAISVEDIATAIGDLPDECRLIVVLSLLQGFSYREIADITDTTYEAVRARLHQGRRLMRRELFAAEARGDKYDMPDGIVRRSKMG